MNTQQSFLELQRRRATVNSARRALTKKTNFLLLAMMLLVFCGAILAQSSGRERQYEVSTLDSLGGTNSRGNSINNRGWIAGYSNLTGNQTRHAALWRNDEILDLGTLGSPERHSNVTWSVKNNTGLVVGISQTDTPEPLGQKFSCWAFFFPLPNNTGYICRGFVWERGEMRALDTLGGYNSFATGANNRRQIVGWAENTVQDPTCEVGTQVLQFRPVVWGPGRNQIRDLPVYPGDTSGAATAINDRGQVVGISGICDQAVGRHSAKHAVLWENGRVTDIGNLGAEYWNTPTAINQRGDIAGFAGTPNDPDGNILRAFIWTRRDGIRRLKPLESIGHVHSEAYGINERRQVVGISCDANFVDCRAVLWQNGGVIDLNDKAPGLPAGVRLEHAKDINDFGEITGRVVDATAGVRKTFLAVPIRRHTRDGGEDKHTEARTNGAMLIDAREEIIHPLSPTRLKLIR